MMATMNTPAITLYGIAHCDTVKKARAWLTAQGQVYQFHDFKKQGVSADLLAAWMSELGWEKLLNRQGTTWRKLDATIQAAVCDATSASTLLQNQPSAIKRPVVVWRTADHSQTTVGFDAGQWAALLDSLT